MGVLDDIEENAKKEVDSYVKNQNEKIKKKKGK